MTFFITALSFALLGMGGYGNMNTQATIDANHDAKVSATHEIRFVDKIQERFDNMIQKDKEKDEDRNEDREDHDRRWWDWLRIDTSAPLFVRVASSTETSTTAQIVWVTNESSNSRVWLSTNATVDTRVAATASSTDLVNFHRLEVKNLLPDTLYYFVVASTDASGNIGTSATYSFKTMPKADTIAPELSTAFAVQQTGHGIRLIWVTNEASDSRVFVSTTSPVVTTSADTKHTSNLTFMHSLRVNDLLPDTTYYYVVASADASGNLRTSTQASFHTEK